MRIGQSAVPNASRLDTIRKLEREIADLRNSKTALENSLAKGSNQVKTLNDELQQSKMLAGLTDVAGPGIVLKLQDSPKGAPSNRQFDQQKYIIHDVDLQQVVSELLAAGAEATSIGEQRVTSRTAIRCVGPTIQVNGVPVAPPFVVQAIGDPATLQGALNLPGGLLDGLRWIDKGMCQVERKPRIVLRGYTGSTEMKVARTVDAKNGSTEKGSDRP